MVAINNPPQDSPVKESTEEGAGDDLLLISDNGLKTGE